MTVEGVAVVAERGSGVSSRRRRGGAWRRFRSDLAAVVGLIILALIAVAAVLAPLLVSHPPAEQSSDLLRGPGGAHPLGTDELGRDQLSRLLYGARESLVVALGSALVGLVLGVPIGLLAGYLGRLWDAVPMRVMDLLLAVPYILVALVVVTALGSNTLNLVIAIGVAAVPIFARLTRASVLALRDRDFVLASRAMGATTPDTMVRTVLPNVLGPLVVQFIVTASVAVVVAAALSFLGLGPAPPAPSWGGMLQESKNYLYPDPWYGVFPGLALAVTVACLDRIGRGLQRVVGTTGETTLNGRT